MIGDKTQQAVFSDRVSVWRKRGWPVFPCSPDTKQPLTKSGFRDASDRLYLIENWTGRWPDAMIGLPTGAPIGAFVVDLDPKGDVTADRLLEDLRKACGGSLPPCPMVRTPRGGYHLYFAMPAGVEIGNRANILGAPKGGAMIDVRGTGGYVIAPPSLRNGPKAVQEGCDGVAYEWMPDSSLDDFDPPQAPVALILLVVSRDRERETDDGGRVAAEPGQDSSRTPGQDAGERERKYAFAAFDRELESVRNAPKGTRNTALNNASLSLASLVAAGALSENMVRAGLEDAAAANGLAKDDGWKSVRATIRSGWKAGFAKPRDLSAVAQNDRPLSGGPRRDIPDPDDSVAPDGAPSGSGDGDGGAPFEPPGDGGDPRKVIQISAGYLPQAVNEAEAALCEAGPGPIFQRSGELVHVSRRPVRRSDGSQETQEVISAAGPAVLREELSYLARFERFDARKEDWVAIDPPPKISDAYFERSSWKLPDLHHLIATPTLRPDGSLLTKQGYDRQTGLYLTRALKGLKVPERPTEDDAEKALALLTEPFRDFPYADRDDEKTSGVGLSVAVAGVIGACLRPVLPAAPLIGITAPKAGTGKSYLVDLISLIATGQRATCLVSGVKLEEFEKALGAILLASLPLLSLDNMVQPLTGQLICMALSQERIDMRVLGMSKTANLPTTTALFATGNNLKLEGDLTRRALLCRLDARMERPEERSFDHDLMAEVRKRRGELVSAALTIARWGYLRRETARDWSLDDPSSGKAFAGFETWCRRIRDPLVALGCRDPVLSLDDVRHSDSHGEHLRILMSAWETEIGDRSLICKKAIHDAQGGMGDLTNAMEAVAGDRSGEINPRRLGAFLKAHEGSPVNLASEGEEPRVKAFYQDGKYQNAVRWQLMPVSVS